MKQILRNLRLLKAAASEQAKAERAHLGNFWFDMSSRLMYNLTLVLFIDQLFARIGGLAGFTKNDFLFMFFVSQTGFYITYFGILHTMEKMVITIRNGNFDLLLLKPVPHRMFLYANAWQPYASIISIVPSMIILAFLINWGQLAITPLSAALGLLVWISGIIITNTLVFGMALPAFKSGDATDTLNMFYSITAMSQMPFSRLPVYMKIAALCITPQVLIAGATAEMTLMKNDAMLLTALLIVAAAGLSLIVYQLMWKYALKNYTSASS